MGLKVRRKFIFLIVHECHSPVFYNIFFQKNAFKKKKNQKKKGNEFYFVSLKFTFGIVFLFLLFMLVRVCVLNRK